MPSSKVKKNTICLSMIVKNEKDIIKTCLASVKGLIDYWIIIDTGSTDGTQAAIKEFMKDIPGELHERPWVNFAHNRNEALQLSKDKAEYSMFMDADEKLVFTKGFKRPLLTEDQYKIIIKERGSMDLGKGLLVRNALDWKWVGVMHEALVSPTRCTVQFLEGVSIHSDTTLGARYKNPKKYLDDANILKKGLEEEPNNTRYQFYLAQCYVSAKEFALALEAYKKRVEMGVGFEHEYFFSLYMIGRTQHLLGMPSKVVIESYKKAHAYRPDRLEPLFYMSLCYSKDGDERLAYETLKKASSTIISTQDDFFIEPDIDWKLQHVLIDVCWKLGKKEETLKACEKLLCFANVPTDVKQESQENIVKLRQLLGYK